MSFLDNPKDIDWSVFIEHGGDFPDKEGLVVVVDAEGKCIFKARPVMAQWIVDLMNKYGDAKGG